MTNLKGRIEIQNDAGKQTGVLNGTSANLVMGGEGASGDIVLRDEQGNDSLHIDGGDGNMRLGGGGHNGDLGVWSDDMKLRIHLDGAGGNQQHQRAKGHVNDLFADAHEPPKPKPGLRSFTRRRPRSPLPPRSGDIRSPTPIHPPGPRAKLSPLAPPIIDRR